MNWTSYLTFNVFMYGDEMIKIKVKNMTENTDEGNYLIDLGSDLEDLFQYLSLEGVASDYFFVVNGKIKNCDYIIEEGVSILIFRAMSGG